MDALVVAWEVTTVVVDRAVARAVVEKEEVGSG